MSRAALIGSACVSIVLAGCGGDGGSPPVGPEEPDPTPVVSSIDVIPQERTIGILGNSFSVRALALTENGEMLYGSYMDPGRFSWSSSAPDVAMLDEETDPSTGGSVRLVKGLREGTATITATSEGLTGSVEVTVRDRARLAWSVPAGRGAIEAGTAIGPDGTIYVGTNSYPAHRSHWYAVSPQGSVLWTLELPLTGRSTPAIGDDGTLYLGSWSNHGYSGSLISVDPGGTVRWLLDDLEGISSSPAIGPNGTIYVAGRYRFYAIDPEGEIQWSSRITDEPFGPSSPAVASDGTIYIGGYDSQLHAIHPDGSLRWTFRARDLIESSPVIGTDGTIYFGSRDGRLYAVGPGGNERWSVEIDPRNAGVFSSPSIGPDGTIYVESGGVFAIDPSGFIRWKFPGSQIGTTPIVGADGTVYVGAWGAIYALGADGALLWDDRALGGNIMGTPAIGVDGTIIAGSFADDYSAGIVQAIAEKRSMNGGYAGAAWPTARGDRANTGRAGG